MILWCYCLSAPTKLIVAGVFRSLLHHFTCRRATVNATNGLELLLPLPRACISGLQIPPFFCHPPSLLPCIGLHFTRLINKSTLLKMLCLYLHGLRFTSFLFESNPDVYASASFLRGVCAYLRGRLLTSPSPTTLFPPFICVFCKILMKIHRECCRVWWPVNARFNPIAILLKEAEPERPTSCCFR